ncbi:phosphatase PAP2 family protein [Glaciibacter sp. 2TAF33]|uniref:phosphatase PAP2 family protein n=1 Tax=Glaciibacter sp. 2TAF33 TaxID=3233015 RepID=UPI003F8DAEE8
MTSHRVGAGTPGGDAAAPGPEQAAKEASKRVANHWPLVSGIAALVCAVALGIVITLREQGAPFAVDTNWMMEMSDFRAPVWDFLALSLSTIGGGVIATLVVPVILVVIFWRVRGRWTAGYYLAASLATGVLAQVLKHAFGRARPDEIAVVVDFGSFPSGHAANAAVTAAVLAILFPRVWVWVAGTLYTVAMMLSRIYLGAHWLSDTIGAVLLGVGVAIVLWAPIAAKIDGERQLGPGRPLVPDAVRRGVRALGDGDAWRNAHQKWIVDIRPLPRPARQRLIAIVIALAVVGAAGFTVILVNVLALSGGATGLDRDVQHYLFGLRSPVLTVVMIALAIVFGPVGLPLIVLVATVAWGFVRRHAWRPLLLAAAMLFGVIVAQLIGHAVGRERPPLDQMLFGPDTTFSFPSGHVLGASDFMLVATYLVVSRRASITGAVIGYLFAGVCIVAAMVSRVYLGYHWTTDALASFSLSLIVLSGVIALDVWRTVRVPEDAQQVTAVPAAP